MEENNNNMGNKMQERMGQQFAHVQPESAKRMYHIELTQIQPNPDQPRKIFTEEALTELAESIKKYGQLQPIVLKKLSNDSYIIAAGERRFRAHQKIDDMERIYAVLTDGDLDEVSLIENVQREDLHPMELAEYLDQMMENHSWNQEQLGDVIGKSRKTINEVLLLNTLPQGIKEEWRTCATFVPKSILVQITREKEPERQMSLWDQAKDGGLSVREVKEKKKETKKKVKSPTLGEKLIHSGNSFTKQLKTAKPEKLSDEDMGQLHELFREIQSVISTIDHKRKESSRE